MQKKVLGKLVITTICSVLQIRSLPKKVLIANPQGQILKAFFATTESI